MIPESAAIRNATEGLARAMVSGETPQSGTEPVDFAASLLAARYPHLPTPAICPYSLLVGMVVGGAAYRAATKQADEDD